MAITRRNMLVGCSSAIAALAGGRIGGLVFASPDDPVERDTLVVVFLRGGCDGLNLVAPTADPNYVTARGALAIPNTGASAGLPLRNGIAPVDFRLHPKGSALKELYDSNQLAIIHACGMTNGTRSHFDAMDFMERGTPDNRNTSTGWLTRHLESISAEGIMPAVAASSSLPGSLLGSFDAVATTNVSGFKLNGHYRYGSQQQTALRAFYNGANPLLSAGKTTLDAVDTIQSRLPRDTNGNPLPYVPENDAEYPSDYYVSGLSNSLKTVAQLIKMDIGLHIATVDFGGWDTHENQSGFFSNQVDGLARALGAFYNDLYRYHGRMTVLVMSEFGRRLKANRSSGTDHGYGNVAMVLGGNVNGGRMYGTWPGLAVEQLDHGVDLAITTDYRRILSEIVVRRLANASLSTVFPNMGAYRPLCVVNGSDMGISWPRPPLKTYLPGLKAVNR